MSRHAAVMQALQANDGVGDDLVEELVKFLNQTDQRQASMEEELRSLKNKVATKASASEVSSLKTKVSNLAAGDLTCEA